MKTILITGSSGFIGYSLTKRLLDETDYKIIGIDNMNGYYDVDLKYHRLSLLKKYNNFEFYDLDIEDIDNVDEVFKKYKPSIVINLAARAGVRESNKNKKLYININIIGFNNILELCSNYKVNHLIFSSSSSVYGDNKNIPYEEEANTDEPISIYAATKKCDEVLAYTYSSLYNMNITGLRFFTVYGPLGRPDMAYYSFTNKLLNKEKIEVYNKGNLRRDFTYIDDIVEGIIRVINGKPKKKYNIYNIGNEHPYFLLDFINTLKDSLIKEKLLDKDFDINKYIKYVDMQQGDVYETYSDTSKFYKDFGFKPKVSLEEGLDKFAKWYKDYNKGE